MIKLQRNVMVLMLLAVLFAAPGAVAYIFFQHPSWLRATPTNRGELLNPPILLASQDQTKQWRLVFWSPTACDMQCMSRMDDLARVRLALGRRLYHVDAELLLAATAKPLSAAAAKTLHDKDVHVLTLSAQDQSGQAALGTKPAIYIINPDQFVILKYTLKNTSDDLFQDIKQLVKDK